MERTMLSRPQWPTLVSSVIVCLVAYGIMVLTGSSQHRQPHTTSATKTRVFDRTPLQSTRSSVEEMATTVPVKLTAIVHDAATMHTATVIFLHGFGDSGAGW
ncbi:unnamed protein product [Mortierella alpina]